MHAYARTVLDRRRRDPGEPLDEGFSVLELVIAVVILGVLAAIAIPIFLTVQAQAEQKALDAVAAEGAAQVSSYLADHPGAYAEQVDLSNLQQDGIVLVATGGEGGAVCVVARRPDGRIAASGPSGGCPPPPG